MEYKKSTIAIILALIALVVVTAVVSFLFFSQPSLFNFFKKDVIKTTIEEVPSQQQAFGHMFFSMIPDNASMPLGIYSYELFTGKLSRVLVDPSVQTLDYVSYYSSSFSDDETMMVFSRNKKNEAVSQIYIASPDGTNLRQITRSSEVFKREPVISPAKNLIAYLVQRTDIKDGEDSELPEGWAVFLTDFSGKVNKVSNGTNPLFSPDGTKLLILKNDGVHLFDIKDIAEVKEIGLVLKTSGGRASQTMKLSLSHDKSMLAWSSPGKNNLMIYKIISWNMFSVSPFRSIPIKAYWSTFSPDGKHLGIQEIRLSPKTGNEYIVIVAYNLETATFTDIVKLNKYANEYFWLGGWIK